MMLPKAWSILSGTLALALLLSACSGGSSSAPTSPATSARTSQPATPPVAAVYKPPHANPGPAVDKLFFKAFDVDRAPLDFQAGQMDAYLFSLKTQAARDLRNKQGIRLDEAPATSISLILNPAPDLRAFNPFSLRGVRQAVQSLVNRDFIASDIYLGSADPMLTHLAPTDYDFLTIFDLAKQTEYRYDPEAARKLINDEMTKAGASLVNGKWSYKGQEIRLKFIVRVEDERRNVGDLIRVELEKAGFNVAPLYQTFAAATRTVYSSDPQALEWHLYTEGWSRGGSQRYDFGTINSMAAPWQGNMPGWRESGFWQYENEQLDTLGKKLFTGNFADAAQRDELYRQMTKIALDESVRIWVSSVHNSFPLNANLQGVTHDLVAGFKGFRTLRDAYIPGRTELTLGNLWVWTERTTWNPVGGFGDVYSSDIARNLSDSPLTDDPFSGLPIPFRATFKVETAGPSGKLSIPTDAVQWDADKDQWAPAAARQATSKVTYDYSKYLSAKWHDGQSITMADVMYSIAQGYELAYDREKSRIETALGVTSRPFLDTFRGYRIADGNTIEVYVDFWHYEQSLIASYAVPSGVSTPWEILAAMDDIVFTQRQGAYSDTAAARFNVPWLSLAMNRDARTVQRTLRTFAERGTLPAGVFVVNGRSLVSVDEAKARYNAASKWVDDKGHLMISNGPFFLQRYDPPAQFAELNAYRDPTYPFKPGDTYRGYPPALEVQRVDQSKVAKGKAADITVQVTGPGTLGLQYVLSNPATGKVLKTGAAQPSGTNQMKVTLDAATTGQLTTGLYRLYLALYSDKIASLSERTVDLEVTS